MIQRVTFLALRLTAFGIGGALGILAMLLSFTTAVRLKTELWDIQYYSALGFIVGILSSIVTRRFTESSADNQESTKVLVIGVLLAVGFGAAAFLALVVLIGIFSAISQWMGLGLAVISLPIARMWPGR
jgi:hypothetical protein